MPRKSCPRRPDPTARKAARRHTRAFHPADADADDLAQEVRLARIQKASGFDPARGTREAYDAIVAKSRVRQLRERHYGRDGCRAWRRTRGDAEPILVRARAPDPDMLLKCAVRQVVATLDPHLQRVCALLLADVARQQIAAEIGIARSTLHRHVQQLRRIFTEAGLDPSVLDR